MGGTKTRKKALKVLFTAIILLTTTTLVISTQIQNSSFNIITGNNAVVDFKGRSFYTNPQSYNYTLETNTGIINSSSSNDGYLVILGIIFIYYVIWNYQNADNLGHMGFMFLLLIYVPIRVYLFFYYRRKRRERGAAVVTVPGRISSSIKAKCMFCGFEIPENSEFCPRCARARARCSVCHEDIFSEDRLVKCPYCGVLSHTEHLSEWIEEKGYCPVCRGRLKEKGITSNLDCLYCGLEIPGNAEYCPHCGEARARCAVCSKDIVSRDLYLKCPYCGVLSHKDHLLKWIKKEGYCPNCREKLKETEIV